MVARDLLEGVADLEDGGVVVHAADDLEADRETVGEAHGDDERRMVGCVEQRGVVGVVGAGVEALDGFGRVGIGGTQQKVARPQGV